MGNNSPRGFRLWQEIWNNSLWSKSSSISSWLCALVLCSFCFVNSYSANTYTGTPLNLTLPGDDANDWGSDIRTNFQIINDTINVILNTSSLTLNATNLVSGTIPNARQDSSSVTLQGNGFNTASKLVLLDSSGYLPALNGSLLTNLPAQTPSSDTALKSSSQTFTAAQTFTSSLTAAGIFGNGYGITNLRPSKLTATADLPDGALTTNVPLLNATNAWTGIQNHSISAGTLHSWNFTGNNGYSLFKYASTTIGLFGFQHLANNLQPGAADSFVLYTNVGDILFGLDDGGTTSLKLRKSDRQAVHDYGVTMGSATISGFTPVTVSTWAATYGSGSAHVCVNNSGVLFVSEAACP